MRNIAFIFIFISIAFCVVNAATCQELVGKLQIDTVCQAGGQDCKAALNTLKYCLIFCANKGGSEDEMRSCSKNNCSDIKNSTVKIFFNELLLSCQFIVSLF